MGRSPGSGLVVIGGDSCSKGREFESRTVYWMDTFSLLFVLKILMCVWKDENELKRCRIGPFLKTHSKHSFETERIKYVRTDWWFGEKDTNPLHLPKSGIHGTWRPQTLHLIWRRTLCQGPSQYQRSRQCRTWVRRWSFHPKQLYTLKYFSYLLDLHFILSDLNDSQHF